MKAKMIAPLAELKMRVKGDVASSFMRSTALICGIMGPFASGKSTACVGKIANNFTQQPAGPDGIVRRRTAVIRNTQPELKTTTIKTWQQWFPPTFGHWVDSGPPRHHIRARNVDWEIWFLGLDRPEDVRKLLSMDLSDAWINEAREMPKQILDGLTGRVGRYPQTIRDEKTRDVIHTCAAPQIIMDTNPPDTDHWWAKMADFPDLDIAEANRRIEESLRERGALGPKQKMFRFFKQPSGRSAMAENLENLPAGYYERLMAGKSPDWIAIYVDGEYGFTQEGKPIYPEYLDSTHCQPFELMQSQPVYIGIDFGLTPAAVFGQRTPMGSWRIHSELVTEDMGAMAFGRLLSRTMQERYAGMRFAAITGDPAGDARSQVDETTPFQALRATGIEARPAHTNDFSKRREAFAGCLTRMIDGKPGMLIHPNCGRLRKALAGGYRRRRLQTGIGTEIYSDEPVKDMHSHVAEAGQYLLLGAGEAREIFKAHPDMAKDRPKFAATNFMPENW
jgi:hypothetical protein